MSSGYRITLGSNIAALHVEGQLGQNTAKLEKVYERLSSGMRINRASDDAAGLAVASSLNVGARVYTQGIRNLNDGQSVLQVADSALSNLSNITIRIKELATQAANGVYSTTQRSAMDNEAQALSKEFSRIVKTTEFNGRSVFAADADGLRIQAGFGVDGGISSGLGGAVGNGQFTVTYSSAASLYTTSMSSGDVNGDGSVDTILGLYAGVTGGDTYIQVQLNRGDGTFSSATSVRIAGSSGVNSYVQSVALADVNNDGILDLISNTVTNVQSLNVQLGKGDGTFGNILSNNYPTGDFALADLNNDGNLDLVTTNSSNVGVRFGNGNGTFGGYATYSLGVGVANAGGGIQLADVNGDGKLDVVAGVQGGAVDSVSVMLGQGNGVFATGTTFATHIIGGYGMTVKLADFNNDGILDFVATSTDTCTGQTDVALGRGNGTFSAANSLDTNIEYGITTLDLNGDGKQDILLSDTSNHSVAFLSKGDGTFTLSASQNVNIGGLLNVADYTNDGVLDIAGGYANLNVATARTVNGIAGILPFSLTSRANALQAMSITDHKLTQISTQRGQIGAFQSRLSIAASNLSSARDNYTAAASRITDTDIASDAAEQTRLTILQNVSASVLAQANQQPALALRLLKT